ncbi:TspO/MBR-related protein [Papiliotrema laurentii]|uniref:TspO/MBR-related protein n=1 Tax=Papiliotrema laurentii TaxID=5418 RepID=A0AAD9FTG5_PAPLA|nr:TspO/MBR-related protein [Papiliotrema laurentii]
MSPLPEIFFDIARNPIFAVGLPIGLGAASGFITGQTSRSNWFTTMSPPPGNPPKEVFGPVWTVLYGLMGYASHLTVRSFDAAITPQATAQADQALTLYYAQLGLNLLWTPLFFGAKQKEIALGNILALTGTVLAMTVKMHGLNTPFSTTWFLAPYCAWLGYASYLNAGYVFLNRDRKY